MPNLPPENKRAADYTESSERSSDANPFILGGVGFLTVHTPGPRPAQQSPLTPPYRLPGAPGARGHLSFSLVVRDSQPCPAVPLFVMRTAGHWLSAIGYSAWLPHGCPMCIRRISSVSPMRVNPHGRHTRYTPDTRRGHTVVTRWPDRAVPGIQPPPSSVLARPVPTSIGGW